MFESPYDNVLWIFFLQLVLPLLLGFVTIAKWRDKLLGILFIAISLILIVKLPVLQYWLVAVAQGDARMSEYMEWLEDQLGFDEVYAQVTYLSEVISGVLTFYCLPLFVHSVNKADKELSTGANVLNWIPVVNGITLGLSLNRLFIGNWMHKVIVPLWSVLVIVWMHYRFLAGTLIFMGVDTVSFAGYFLYGEEAVEETNEAGWPLGKDSYTYLTDLLYLITLFTSFVAGFATLVVVALLQKRRAAALREVNS